MQSPQSKEKSDSSRILITGGTGFVAPYVCRALMERGYSIEDLFVASQDGGAAPIAGAQNIQLDLRDQDSLDLAVREVQPTSVIHLAAISVPAQARNNVDRAWEVNFQGTLSLARSIQTHTPKARLIFAGSAEAYGRSFENLTHPIEEYASLAPLTVYGATKACAEIALMQMAGDGLDVVCFRAFNHTGIGQTTEFVVPAFASQIAASEKPDGTKEIHVGDLDVSRDFLDVRDVADAYALAVGYSAFEMSDRVLNIASGKPIRIQEILNTLLEASQKDIDVVVDPKRARRSQIPYACGSIKKCSSVLGWRPQVDIKQTLIDVLNGFRSDATLTTSI